MGKPKHEDFDDGFEQESHLEDEAVAFERIQRRREHRPPDKFPKGPREGGASPSSDKPNRRGDLASLNAWGSPY